MKTEEIIENMRICYKGKCDKCTMVMKSDCIDDLLRVAAEKLWKNEVEINNQRCEIEALKKRVNKPGTQKSQEWISTKDGIPAKDIKVLSYDKYGSIGTYYFDKDYSEEKSTITHWMFLPDPPKKVKTYKDVFLEAFPNADMIEKVTPRVCRLYIFGSDTTQQCEWNCTCEDCWNQPYPEKEGGAE